MRIKRDKIIDEIHTTLLVEWYAGSGYFIVKAVGHGPNLIEADKNAHLMLGQARAQLIQETGEADKLGFLADFMGHNK